MSSSPHYSAEYDTSYLCQALYIASAASESLGLVARNASSKWHARTWLAPCKSSRSAAKAASLQMASSSAPVNRSVHSAKAYSNDQPSVHCKCSLS